MMVNIYEAKTRLSRLLEAVEAGEEVVIARAGRPVARLVAFDRDRRPRSPGGWKGRWALAPDWEAPEVGLAIVKGFADGAVFPGDDAA